MHIEKNEAVLSSGRRIGLHCEGLFTLGNDGTLLSGHDNAHIFWGDPNDNADRDKWPLTPEERAEIADFMIALWQEWKTSGSIK